MILPSYKSALGFALRQNDSGNLNREMDCLVLPPQINCIGKNVPYRVMTKVPVMLLLSADPATDTDLEPFFAKLCLPTGIYFKGVW